MVEVQGERDTVGRVVGTYGCCTDARSPNKAWEVQKEKNMYPDVVSIRCGSLKMIPGVQIKIWRDEMAAMSERHSYPQKFLTPSRRAGSYVVDSRKT